MTVNEMINCTENTNTKQRGLIMAIKRLQSNFTTPE